MGLAASQARFLAITSRKMNCEFESMQIAQQKLSVTREQQKAAQEYQDALTATKLVWDADNNCDGTGDVYNLSYDLMMTPSALNEYDAFLVTDTQGRVVLSESMFNAAVKAGIVDSNGNPRKTAVIKNEDGKEVTVNQYSEQGRNAFLEQLGAVGTIDGSVISGITSLKGSYTEIGVGGNISDKKIAKAMNTPTFINHLKDAKYQKGDTNSNIVSLTPEKELAYPIVNVFATEGSPAGTVTPAGSKLSSAGNYVLTTYKAGDTVDIAINGYDIGSTAQTAQSDWRGTKTDGTEVTGKTGASIPANTKLKLAVNSTAPVDISVYVPTKSVKHKEGDLKYAMDFSSISGTAYKVVSDPKENNNVRINKNGQSLTSESMKNLTLGDILSGKCEFTAVAESDAKFEELAQNILTEMAKLLGYNAGATEFKGLNVDKESNEALAQALDITKAQLQSTISSSGNWSNLQNAAQ